MIKYFDIFAGIGGFRSGLEKAGGFKCVGYCEIDKYAKKAYETLYDTRNEVYYDDARKIDPNELPDLDLICGGFPCQSFSIAGKRKGFSDTRGTLFFEIARIAAIKKPKYLLLENVPGLLSHDEGRTFATILSTLDEIGYDVWWQVCNSANFGVPQSRNRLYIIGYNRKKCEGEILPFNQTNPKTIIRRLPGSEGRRVYSSEALGITLTASSNTGLYIIPIPVKSKTKNGYQLAFPNDSIDIAYIELNSRRGRVGAEIAHTLMTGSTQAYYFIDMNPNPKLTELARCITARQDSGINHRKGEHSGVMAIVKELTADEVLQLGDKSDYWTFENPNDDTITALIIFDNEGNFFIGYIRRLTPRECWRLQGFTDEQFDKVISAGISDTQLYKMAGKAVSVPVISAFGKQIKRILNKKQR